MRSLQTTDNHRAKWLAAPLLLASALACGGGHQSIASIRAAAEDFVGSQPAVQQLDAARVVAAQLDRRLQLPQCDQPLEAFIPAGGRLIGKTNIGVRCTGGRPWTLYVPITITALQQVPVSNRALRRGALLSAADISLMEQPLHQLPAGHFDSAEQVIGMELKRNIQAGQPLTSAMLAPPKIIKRGQQVTLVAKNNSFEVRMSGKALADAAIGQRLRVQNLSSKKVVEGTVDNRGEVRVNQ